LLKWGVNLSRNEGVNLKRNQGVTLKRIEGVNMCGFSSQGIWKFIKILQNRLCWKKQYFICF
jgi:hypothetical protein